VRSIHCGKLYVFRSFRPLSINVHCKNHYRFAPSYRLKVPLQRKFLDMSLLNFIIYHGYYLCRDRNLIKAGYFSCLENLAFVAFTLCVSLLLHPASVGIVTVCYQHWSRPFAPRQIASFEVVLNLTLVAALGALNRYLYRPIIAILISARRLPCLQPRCLRFRRQKYHS
jgi:hypothetical protein